MDYTYPVEPEESLHKAMKQAETCIKDDGIMVTLPLHVWQRIAHCESKVYENYLRQSPDGK